MEQEKPTSEHHVALGLYHSWTLTSEPYKLKQCIQICTRTWNFDGQSSWSCSSEISPIHLLGKAVCTHAILSSSVEELDEGIEHLHSSLACYSSVHPCIRDAVADLACALHSRWNLNEELDDLNLSISLRRIVVSDDVQTSPLSQIYSISSLSTALFLRFTHFPRLSDINEVVDLDTRALLLSSKLEDEGPLCRLSCLCLLAQSQLVKWDYDGAVAGIETAIGHLRNAQLLADSEESISPLDRALVFNALSEAIQNRLFLSEADIEECITLDTKALSLVPTGHEERPLTLASMASTLLVRHTVFSEEHDLVRYQSIWEELRSSVAEDRAVTIDYWEIFQGMGKFSRRAALHGVFRQRLYIKRAESDSALPALKRTFAPDVFLRRLIDQEGSECHFVSLRIQLLRTRDERKRALIRGAGISWTCRGKHYLIGPGLVLSFGEWIEYWLDHSFLPSDGHPWLYAYYTELSGSLCNPFSLDTSPERPLDNILPELDLAREYVDKAIALLSTEHPCYHQNAETRALLYLLRAETEYEHKSPTAQEAVDHAIHQCRMAVDAHRKDIPDAVTSYLVDLYIIRHRLLNSPSDLETAVSICRQNAEDETADKAWRWELGDKLVDITDEFSHPAHLEALVLIIRLRDAWASDSVSISGFSRQLIALDRPDLLSQITEHCMTQQDYVTAWNLIGRSRGIIWARLLQLKTRTLKHDHANFAKLALLLEAAEMERQLELPLFQREVVADPLGAYSKPRLPGLNESTRTGRLAAQVERVRNQASTQINSVPRPFTESLPEGTFPVVVLCASITRCDALIFRGPCLATVHVPLPECDRKTLDDLVVQMQSILRDNHLLVRSERKVISIWEEELNPPGLAFDDILATIWNTIVGPIMKALHIEKSESPLRLWWYPMGPFCQLPLHAAGVNEFGTLSVTIQDYVISTYLPAFEMARRVPPRTDNHRILAVYQKHRPGQLPLPAVEIEVKHIEAIAHERNVPFTVLGGSRASIASIVKALPSASIVHFALHGKQGDAEAPMESALLLDDNTNLELSQLMEMSLPEARLVFLSACQTATGDVMLSEEVVHIAAAMLFVGFQDAIGTMWSISDEDGPTIAKAVYTHLLGPNPVDAAHALHIAVKSLRLNNAPAIRWAPFIHVGG